MQAPLDLRKELASSILVAGGTAMLPGFISRLHYEILRLLEPPVDLLDPADAAGQGDRQLLLASPTTPRPGASFPTNVGAPPSTSTRRDQRQVHDAYETLRPLAPYIAILNHPNPPILSTQSSMARKNAGNAPGFAPAALPWVGASLAGCVLYFFTARS
jgi:actin-related protein 10